MRGIIDGMDRSTLAHGHCVPCEGIGRPLDPIEVARYLALVPLWSLRDDGRIERTFRHSTFRDGFALASRIADLADEEGHHPELEIAWGRCTVRLVTHALGGLTVNDFVLAARIDGLAAGGD